jgi:hypothetical protein
LWYGMFMSDQHQSILNNRESLLPLHLEVLQKREEYLQSEAHTSHDLRLVAQSALLLIMARMKRAFGSEYPTPVPASRAPEFPSFSAELDSWIDDFRPRFRELKTDLTAPWTRSKTNPEANRSRPRHGQVPAAGIPATLPFCEALSRPSCV